MRILRPETILVRVVFIAFEDTAESCVIGFLFSAENPIKIKEKNKNEILDNFKKRISFNPTTEFDEALKQVKQIASLRLKELNNKVF